MVRLRTRFFAELRGHMARFGIIATERWRNVRQLFTGLSDIAVLLFLGYVVGYPLAVYGPIFIDPALKSHLLYPPRHYKYAFVCIFIFISLLFVEAILLK